MSYKNLDIWKLAKELTLEIHDMTLTQLPGFEKFETGSQIRRSSKSVRSNIVEGYGRRKYKQDFIRFLIIAQASLDETIDHIEMLYEVKSLSNTDLYSKIHNKLEILGRKLNRFIQSVEVQHNNLIQEPAIEYQVSNNNILDPESDIEYQRSEIEYPESNIQDLVSSIQDHSPKEENLKTQNKQEKNKIIT